MDYQAPDYLIASTGLTAEQLKTQFEGMYVFHPGLEPP